MTAIQHAINAAPLHFLWEGVLVAFLLWVILATLRNGSARLRYAVSCAALGIMAALPPLTVWWVYGGPAAATRFAGNVVQSSGSADMSGLQAAGWLPAWIAVLEAWALPVWFCGVVLFAIRLFWGTREVARLRSNAEPAEAALVAMVARLARRMRVTRAVGVGTSKHVDSPSLVGWMRPVILLPAATLLHLSVEQLESVLAHEMAHVRRHDYLVNMLQSLVETLLFYHPAVWWVSSQIRREREFCCDDLVVATCGDAANYARALAELERERVMAPALSSAAGPLLSRIQG